MGLIKMPGEIAPKENISILIYGQPGCGKTTLGCSAPNAVLFDFDGGVNRINGAHQIPTLQVHTWKDVEDALKEIDSEMPSCESIIIDTAGKMVDCISQDIMEENPKMRKADGTLSLQGYGLRKLRFINFLNRLSYSGRNAIFIAHEREEKRGDDVFKRPEIGGSSANDLIKELDLVGYMSAVGRDRGITFDINEYYYAKNTCNLQPCKLPVLVDQSGEAVGKNDYLQKVIAQFRNTQMATQVKTKGYKEVMDSAAKALSEVETLEDLNAVVDDFKKVKHVMDSKVRIGMMLNEKAAALGYVLNKRTKRYEEPARPEA